MATAGWRMKCGVGAGVSATHFPAHVKRSAAPMDVASAPTSGIPDSSLGEIDKLTSNWRTGWGGGAGPFPAYDERSVGLMDKASAPGAGDSRFESWADH